MKKLITGIFIALISTIAIAENPIQPTKEAQSMFEKIIKQFPTPPSNIKLYIADSNAADIVATTIGNDGVIISAKMNNEIKLNYKTNQIAAAMSIAIAELASNNDKKSYTAAVAVGYFNAAQAGYDMCEVTADWERKSFRVGYAAKYSGDATYGIMYGAAKAACQKNADASYLIAIGQ